MACEDSVKLDSNVWPAERFHEHFLRPATTSNTFWEP